MFTVDNKYEIGQEVYIVQKGQSKEKCPACNGQGYKIIDGNKFSCVKCYGTGHLRGKSIYQIIGKDTIDRIKTYKYRLHNRTNNIKIKTIVQYGFRGSRDDYTDAKLFLTEEEAIATCEKLNGNAVN